MDNNTGSSGELTALCFKGIPNVKFLGSDSAGYTSANQTVYLYDGSTLQITSAFVKDRTNNIYKNFPISPDIQTNNAKSSAIEWIKSQIK
ncbi:S41 family peptidase [Lactococcus lactis]|uniref:S41 family peptidase n=1 Tax=Lactococcus lactis TaxID=1358 RepID=UPI0024092469|nr:S41 family peptidase [Lactococcus lactis]